jgi:hypothetical protein
MRATQLLFALAATSLIAATGHAGGAAGTEKPEDPKVVRERRVKSAVARGVAWLRDQQESGGAFGPQPGETALALLALRHSGVPADDPACRRAELSLLRELPDGTSYGAALGLVALLGQEGSRCRDEAAVLVKDLADAQCENGQWGYSARRSSRASAGDNSNTQIAVFALAAAKARGLDVPSATFEKALAFHRGSLNKDGGWGYAPNQRSASYGSMTAGGAMSAALSKIEIAPGDARLREVPEIRGALSWLGQRFSAAENPGAAAAFGSKKGRRGDDFWAHYWLWSVERACSVTGTERLGERDWYAIGADHLLEEQRKDGSWLGPERAVLATSFSLLFFARGTLAVVTPRRPAPGSVTPR